MFAEPAGQSRVERGEIFVSGNFKLVVVARAETESGFESPTRLRLVAVVGVDAGARRGNARIEAIVGFGAEAQDQGVVAAIASITQVQALPTPCDAGKQRIVLLDIVVAVVQVQGVVVTEVAYGAGTQRDLVLEAGASQRAVNEMGAAFEPPVAGTPGIQTAQPELGLVEIVGIRVGYRVGLIT